jgi:cell division protease FtsH
VTEYGMGTDVKSRRMPVDDYSLSDATRRIVDDEQAHLTEAAYRQALAMVMENRPLLDAFAERLLEQEVLGRADIERIMREHGPARVAGVPGGEARVAAAERFEREDGK